MRIGISVLQKGGKRMNAAVTVTANHPPSSACQRIATMYAMDYPYQYQLDEVNAMDNMTMSAEDKK